MRRLLWIVPFLFLVGCSLIGEQSREKINKYSADIQGNIRASHDYFEKLCLEDLEDEADRVFGGLRDQYIDAMIEFEEGGALTLPNILAEGDKFVKERERLRSELLARAAKHTKYLRSLTTAEHAIGVYNDLMIEIDKREKAILQDIYNTELPELLKQVWNQGSVNDEMEKVIYSAAERFLTEVKQPEKTDEP